MIFAHKSFNCGNRRCHWEGIWACRNILMLWESSKQWRIRLAKVRCWVWDYRLRNRHISIKLRWSSEHWLKIIAWAIILCWLWELINNRLMFLFLNLFALFIFSLNCRSLLLFFNYRYIIQYLRTNHTPIFLWVSFSYFI